MTVAVHPLPIEHEPHGIKRFVREGRATRGCTGFPSRQRISGLVHELAHQGRLPGPAQAHDCDYLFFRNPGPDLLIEIAPEFRDFDGAV